MKRLLVTLIILLPFSGFAKGETRYLFFLHNKFLELSGVEGVHPEYGKAEYREIVTAFEKGGFTVISELRPDGTDGDKYAEKIAKQIDDLLKKE